MKNSQSELTTETSLFVTTILFLAGVIGLLIAEFANWSILGVAGSWQRHLLSTLSVFVISVLVVSWLYEKFLIEKHFRQFRNLLYDQLRTMDTIQSKALKLVHLGINETLE
ncbi:MAG: hypothetical protein FJZ86_14615 [Chloroflexi bacterium]|nr:hypothetical protein [Chloroflexota bacterium]